MTAIMNKPALAPPTAGAEQSLPGTTPAWQFGGGGGRAWLIVRLLVGGLLLTAAGLKMWALFVVGPAGGALAGIDAFSRDSILFSPRLQIAAIQAEVILGLWLLSNVSPRAARWSALGFFTLLAAASLYLALAGQESCGCFGDLAVSPWWTLALDLAVIAALLVAGSLREPRLFFSALAGARKTADGTRSVPATVSVGDCSVGDSLRESPSSFLPQLAERVGHTSSSQLAERVGHTAKRSRWPRVALGAFALVFLAGSSFFLFADDPHSLLARLRGETLTVWPAVSDLGAGPAGETREFAITLTNHGDDAIRIVGGTSSCACTATRDLPLTLRPGDSATIAIRAKFSGSPGRFQHSFVLYTDAERQRTLIARFGGRVLEVEEPHTHDHAVRESPTQHATPESP